MENGVIGEQEINVGIGEGEQCSAMLGALHWDFLKGDLHIWPNQGPSFRKCPKTNLFTKLKKMNII